MPAAPRTSRLLFTLLLGASVLSACGDESSATLVSEARAKLAAGDYKTAMIQLKNALAEDARNAEARFELGRLYLEQSELASAEKEFRRAREAGYAAQAVNPMIARALLGQREFQRLLDELPAPAEQTPDAAVIQALRATAELGLGRKEDARKALAQAQASAPDAADVRLALAQLALADNDPGKALQELDHALRVTPGHLDCLLLKGDILRATGKRTEAAAAYAQVLQRAPHNTNAHLALAGIAIADARLADARKSVAAALKGAPGNLTARYLEALLDFRENKTEQARDRLTAVLKTAPDFVPALLLGGSIEFALGNLQTAETYLNKVVKATPDHPYALRLLAAAQLRLGRPDDAARTLAPMLRGNVRDAGVLIVAGEIALARKDFTQATQYFEQAAQLAPDNAAVRTELGISRLASGDARAMADLQAAARMDGSSNRADTVIILNQLKLKQFDAALASIAALEKKQGATPLTWNYRGAAFIGKQDPARARDAFSQALRLDPAFFPAAANLAQLDLRDQQPAAARQRFEGVLRADPKSLNAMLALADLALRSGDEKTYVSWLEKASGIHPQALEPRVALARHRLAKGETSQALATAREAADAHPDHPVALDTLGAAQLAQGDTVNAIATFRKLAEQAPQPAGALTRLATAQLSARLYADARTSLNAALRAQPDLLDAQLMLAGLDIRDKRYDDALKLARQVQQQKPRSAAGPALEGDIALARMQPAAALAAFERAQALEPSGALLARQCRALDSLERAAECDKRLAAWLAAHPQDAATRMALAERLLKRKQYAAAAEHYLLLDKRTPNNPVILNNLAWALDEAGDRRAAGFAERALKLQPDNPAVMDTLAWILVRQGRTDAGIKLLQQALSKAPDAAEIHWHLAAAYAKRGDQARARSELERLLASGAAFPQEQEARTLLAQLKRPTR